MEDVNHFNQWGIVLITLTIFGWFIFRFLKPKKKIEWRNAGIFGAFIIALYAEMYGFPLTIYILSSVFGVELPFGHISGHLWTSLLGLGETGAMVEMLVGYLIMIIGGLLVITGWEKIYKAKDELVTDGIYKYMRHPQYAGIILVTFGMLIHWPTLITLLLFPVLVSAYYGLAKKEEKEMEKKFDGSYLEYKREVPMFLPKLNLKIKRLDQRVERR